jgi:hypothetical protein
MPAMPLEFFMSDPIQTTDVAAPVKPAVGHRFWFWPSLFDRGLQESKPATVINIINVGEPCEAAVTYVHGDRMVNITLTDHSGTEHARPSVLVVQPGDPVPDNGLSYVTLPDAGSVEVNTSAVAAATDTAAVAAGIDSTHPAAIAATLGDGSDATHPAVAASAPVVDPVAGSGSVFSNVSSAPAAAEPQMVATPSTAAAFAAAAQAEPASAVVNDPAPPADTGAGNVMVDGYVAPVSPDAGKPAPVVPNIT